MKDIFGNIVLIIVLAIFAYFAYNAGRYAAHGDVTPDYLDTIVITHHDTINIVKTDSFPLVHKVVITDTLFLDPIEELEKDTPMVALQVVQKTFSDDSTYTAYISGVNIGNLPSLDSIRVYSSVVHTMVQSTIAPTARPSRLRFGVGGGYGYGLRSGTFQPFIGFGLYYIF